ncbi:hypothetical protein [Paraflavitalea sp. CAU 1676]|uniref:hypothetical protein n=1 Tax=Paraflavitalea sp. CAU 1676 TaxID=3032598 RepID=UPI0023DB130B|nr:hypothetical protein [Paraflavitalea sp. CAU 1676]MDF2189319.1 hypothetical protein [Paraflavitalea sp. CAU 1676]
MSFFHQIHNLGDDADLTLRIVRKDDKLTIDVRPGARTGLTPKILTGTPEELADGFLQAITKKPEPQAGLSVQDLPTESSEKKEQPAKKESPAAAKKGKDKGKAKQAAQKPEKKEKPAKPKPAAPREVSMFDQPADDDKTDQEVDAELEAANLAEDAAEETGDDEQTEA